MKINSLVVVLPLSLTERQLLIAKAKVETCLPEADVFPSDMGPKEYNDRINMDDALCRVRYLSSLDRKVGPR
jgi:hypothetical protein